MHAAENMQVTCHSWRRGHGNPWPGLLRGPGGAVRAACSRCWARTAPFLRQCGALGKHRCKHYLLSRCLPATKAPYPRHVLRGWPGRWVATWRCLHSPAQNSPAVSFFAVVWCRKNVWRCPHGCMPVGRALKHTNSMARRSFTCTRLAAYSAPPTRSSGPRHTLCYSRSLLCTTPNLLVPLPSIHTDWEGFERRERYCGRCESGGQKFLQFMAARCAMH